MLSMISIPVTALAVGLPAQRAIAQRFSALAHRVISLRRSDLVAFGAKRTFSEPSVPTRIYESAP